MLSPSERMGAAEMTEVWTLPQRTHNLVDLGGGKGREFQVWDLCFTSGGKLPFLSQRVNFLNTKITLANNRQSPTTRSENRHRNRHFTELEIQSALNYIKRDS